MNNKLAKKMREAQISQKDLAWKVGVSNSYISFVCRGFKSPSVIVARRIADVLECKIDDIF